MKKKLLSVLMAGALVATSSVNAFATTHITGSEGTSHDAEITITGDVENNRGETKPGTLSVTVPTATNFMVDKTGAFTAPSINIKNNGTQKIDVFAYEFIDVNGEAGIKVMQESELDSEKRTSISLKLVGSEGVAYFKTEVGGLAKGVYLKPDHSQAADRDIGVKVASIEKNSSKELTLDGVAGKSDAEVNNPEKDNFTLKLKIKKSEAN